jgi:hypothetical protein
MQTGSSGTLIGLAGNLVKPLISLYGTEWRERGYGLCLSISCRLFSQYNVLLYIILNTTTILVERIDTYRRRQFFFFFYKCIERKLTVIRRKNYFYIIFSYE